MYDIKKTCAFTGHRDIPHELYQTISDAIRREIYSLYQKGVRHFIAGGAIGFDMISAVTVLNLKSTLPDITLHLAIPCPNHYTKWKSSDKALFCAIRARADSEITVSPQYDKGCMYKRNRYMVDNSSYLISYCKKKSGGTYYTEKYAEGKKLIVKKISDYLSAEK